MCVPRTMWVKGEDTSKFKLVVLARRLPSRVMMQTAVRMVMKGFLCHKIIPLAGLAAAVNFLGTSKKGRYAQLWLCPLARIPTFVPQLQAWKSHLGNSATALLSCTLLLALSDTCSVEDCLLWGQFLLPINSLELCYWDGSFYVTISLG